MQERIAFRRNGRENVDQPGPIGVWAKIEGAKG